MMLRRACSPWVLLIIYVCQSFEAWAYSSPLASLDSHTTSTSCTRTSPLYVSAAELHIHKDVIDEEWEYDESASRSEFGTKVYWDEVYAGRGDFPADEYSWYYDWNTFGSIVCQHLPTSSEHDTTKLLIPGIGNDPILLDLLRAGYRHITAQDYSAPAVDRQKDFLGFAPADHVAQVTIEKGNVRALPKAWRNRFTGVVEKGLLDAVYLSGDGHFEEAVRELHRVTSKGGIIISVSGVVPQKIRNEAFAKEEWTRLRDGNKDLKAGYFVFQKR